MITGQREGGGGHGRGLKIRVASGADWALQLELQLGLGLRLGLGPGHLCKTATVLPAATLGTTCTACVVPSRPLDVCSMLHALLATATARQLLSV